MDASKHKLIVFGAMGCAGVLVVGFVVLFLIGRHAALHDTVGAAKLRRDAADAFREMAVAGYVDPSLPTVDPADRLPHAGHAIAELSRQACDTTQLFHEWIPFGDSFPATSSRRREWQAAARWTSVGWVLAAIRDTSAFEAWGPGDCHAIQFPWRLMIEGRAVLARAREQADSGAIDAARHTLRAMVAIGRALSAGDRLPDAEVGLRLQRDALAMLASVSAPGDTARIRREADGINVIRSLTTALLQRIATVAADTGFVDSLAGLATSSQVPLVVRGEMVRMIGLGWVGDRSEELGGIAPVREAALTKLADQLADGLEPQLQEAQHDARLPLLYRFAASNQFVLLRGMWMGVPLAADST